jgi:hypothetical protein
MPKQRKARLGPRRTRQGPGRSTAPFRNNFFTENFIGDNGMSSTTNTFRYSYQKSTPSLQSTPRLVRLHMVIMTIPPVPYTVDSATVQIFRNDPVTNSPVALTPGRVLSTTRPTTIRMRIPSYYSQFYPTNSADEAFTMVYFFPVNQTFKSYCRIICTYFLGFDLLGNITPSSSILPPSDDFVKVDKEVTKDVKETTREKPLTSLFAHLAIK